MKTVPKFTPGMFRGAIETSLQAFLRGMDEGLVVVDAQIAPHPATTRESGAARTSEGESGQVQRGRVYFSVSTQARDQTNTLIEMHHLYNCASRVSVHEHSPHVQTRRHGPRPRTSTSRPSLLAPQLLFQFSRQCVSCTHRSPFVTSPACCTRETPNAHPASSANELFLLEMRLARV